MYGPDVTFVGVPAAHLDDPASFAGAAAVVIGAPFDGGTSHRPGCRFGPQAIRVTDYLPHDGRRPHLALGVDPLVELGVVDVGDVEMPAGDIEGSLEHLERAVETVAGAGAVPVVLGGDHTIALPDVTGVARQVGWGRVSVIHFDAHADTGDTQFGSLLGHGTPMRRLIESGATRGDRFLQIGLRGYWPEPETLAWMDEQGMRSYEMTEVTARGLDECLTEASAIALDDCDAVFLSVDVDVVDPGSAPGTGTPEPGGLSARALLDAVRRLAMELPVAGLDVVEVAPPYDHAEITAYLANRIVLEALSGMAWRRRRTAGGRRAIRESAPPGTARRRLSPGAGPARRASLPETRTRSSLTGRGRRTEGEEPSRLTAGGRDRGTTASGRSTPATAAPIPGWPRRSDAPWATPEPWSTWAPGQAPTSRPTEWWWRWNRRG